MIRFRLEELLKARGWTNYRFGQESGIAVAVIGKYRRNLMKQPDLTIMSKMCETLQCGTGDLTEYVPDKVEPKAKSKASKKR